MYYYQDTEVNLLVQFLKHLDNKTVIDVGAERGNFVEAFLQAGAEVVYAVEPYPASVAVLRDRFAQQSAVRVLEMALGERDEPVTLHIIRDKTNRDSDSFHTLVPFEETATLQSVGELMVQCRTLHRLLNEGEIPAEVGILKIDTERSDFAVLRGMGTLVSDVIMAEFWVDLPETVGESAYRLDDLITFLQARGYSHFVLVKRYREFEVVQMDNSFTRQQEWGNIIFIRNTVFDTLAPLIYTSVQEAQTRLVDKAALYLSECQKRLEVIEEQRQAITEQVQIMERLASNERTLTEQIRQRFQVGRKKR